MKEILKEQSTSAGYLKVLLKGFEYKLVSMIDREKFDNHFMNLPAYGDDYWAILQESVKLKVFTYKDIRVIKSLSGFSVRHIENDRYYLAVFKSITTPTELEDALQVEFLDHGVWKNYVAEVEKAIESKLISKQEDLDIFLNKLAAVSRWMDYTKIIEKAIEQRLITDEKQINTYLSPLRVTGYEYWNIKLKAVEFKIVKNDGYQEIWNQINKIDADWSEGERFSRVIAQVNDLIASDEDLKFALQKMADMQEWNQYSRILIKAIEQKVFTHKDQNSLRTYLDKLEKAKKPKEYLKVYLKAVEEGLIWDIDKEAFNENLCNIGLRSISKPQIEEYAGIILKAIDLKLINNEEELKDPLSQLAQAGGFGAGAYSKVLLKALEYKVLTRPHQLRQPLEVLLSWQGWSGYAQVMVEALKLKVVLNYEDIKELLGAQLATPKQEQFMSEATFPIILQVIKDGNESFINDLFIRLLIDQIEKAGDTTYSNSRRAACRYLVDWLNAHPQGLGDSLNKRLADALVMEGTHSGTDLHELIFLCARFGILTNREANSIFAAETSWAFLSNTPNNPNHFNLANLPGGSVGAIVYQVLGYSTQGVLKNDVYVEPDRQVVIEWEGDGKSGVYQDKVPSNQRYSRARLRSAKGKVYDFIAYLGEPSENLGREFREGLLQDNYVMGVNPTLDLKVLKGVKVISEEQWFKFYSQDAPRMRKVRTIWNNNQKYHVAFLGFNSRLSYALYQIIESGAIFMACMNGGEFQNRLLNEKRKTDQYLTESLSKFQDRLISFLKQVSLDLRMLPKYKYLQNKGNEQMLQGVRNAVKYLYEQGSLKQLGIELPDRARWEHIENFSEEELADIWEQMISNPKAKDILKQMNQKFLPIRMTFEFWGDLYKLDQVQGVRAINMIMSRMNEYFGTSYQPLAEDASADIIQSRYQEVLKNLKLDEVLYSSNLIGSLNEYLTFDEIKLMERIGEAFMIGQYSGVVTPNQLFENGFKEGKEILNKLRGLNLLTDDNQYLRGVEPLKSKLKASFPLYSEIKLDIIESILESSIHRKDVSHYLVFGKMNIVSQPLQPKAKEKEKEKEIEPFAYLHLDERLSESISDPLLRGRRNLLGQGKTARALITNLGFNNLDKLSVLVYSKNSDFYSTSLSVLDIPLAGQEWITVKLRDEAKTSKKEGDSAQMTEADRAMRSNTGGIDLTSDKALQVKNDGNGEIKFHLDSAQLTQLQNAPGFYPVIISIEPLDNLKAFLCFNL
ncbi:MAG: hypothetical protein HQL15_07915 [Candidatus Omnitrophica bacterium]|nr:hypothetical protein [Candidatus Omnitrophota bacterium]